MTKRIKQFAVIPLSLMLVIAGWFGTYTYINSQIAHRVAMLSPHSSGISVKVPLSQVATDVVSPDIRSARISIASFHSKGSPFSAAMNIAAKKISKNAPFTVDSLDVSATISVKTLESLSGFSDASVVNGALQVSVGTGGLGKAILTPKVSGSQLYFSLKSITLFGSEIPASTLPPSIQDQIKSKSLRNLSFPKGLTMTSATLKPQGMVIHLHGNNFSLANLNYSQ